MTIGNPIRLDRFQRGLVEFFADVAGLDATWAYQSGLLETMPDAFVNLTMVSGPTLPITFGRGTSFAPATSVLFEVTAVDVGSMVSVRVNGLAYRVQVELGATLESIRDALVAAITADDSGEYTAANGVDPAQWVLTPTSFGSVWDFASTGAMTATPTISSSLATLTQGRAVASVAIDVFSRSSSPRAGAWALANRVAVGLALPSVGESFRAWGFGMGAVGPLADLTAIAGAAWQSRVRFPVSFNLQFSVAVPVARIERVEIGAGVTQPLLQFSETTP